MGVILSAAGIYREGAIDGKSLEEMVGDAIDKVKESIKKKEFSCRVYLSIDDVSAEEIYTSEEQGWEF